MTLIPVGRTRIGQLAEIARPAFVQCRISLDPMLPELTVRILSCGKSVEVNHSVLDDHKRDRRRIRRQQPKSDGDPVRVEMLDSIVEYRVSLPGEPLESALVEAVSKSLAKEPKGAFNCLYV